MHLDCVFSILGDKCCIMLEEMMGQDSKTKRLVDEYSRNPSTGNPGVSGRGTTVHNCSPCTDVICPCLSEQPSVYWLLAIHIYTVKG